MNLHWQNESDLPCRRVILSKIIRILQKKRSCSNATRRKHTISYNKIVVLAKHVEMTLYHQANSRDEYIDTNTLQQRIRQVAYNTIQVTQEQCRNSILQGIATTTTTGSSTDSSNACPCTAIRPTGSKNNATTTTSLFEHVSLYPV